MKVFICWSGERSKSLGEALRVWLPSVLQAVKPYFTPDDVAKGARWASEIAAEIATSDAGIICLTRENLGAPWIMFEAGALSKALEKGMVCPLLLDLNPVDVKAPLSLFQASRCDRAEIERLVGTLNLRLGSDGLDDATLKRVFEKWWPELEEQLGQIGVGVEEQGASGRPDRELLEEVLVLARLQSERPAYGPSWEWPPDSRPESLRNAMETMAHSLMHTDILLSEAPSDLRAHGHFRLIARAVAESRSTIEWLIRKDLLPPWEFRPQADYGYGPVGGEESV